MATVTRMLAPVKGLGRERLTLLGVTTGGHTAIHWYQQIFPVVLPSLKAGLGLNDVEVGALSTARQMTSGALNLPAGMAADAYARHRARILALSIVVMGLAYLLLGLSPALLWALPAAGLVGLGTALWHPAAMASLSTRFPERRALALGVHGVGATIGDTLTPLAVGALLLTFHWRGVLQLQLIPAVLVALLVWRSLGAQFAAEPPLEGRRQQWRGVAALLKNPVFLGVSGAQGFMGISRNVVLTFLPIYLQEHLGYSTWALGVYVALLHGMGVVSQPVLGVLADRFGRKAVLVPSFLILGALFALLVVATPGVHLVLVITAIGVFFYTLTNVTSAAVFDVAGARVQASSMGLTSIITQGIALPAPIIAGALIEATGIASAFWMAAGFMVLAALVLLPLRMYKGSRPTPKFSG